MSFKIRQETLEALGWPQLVRRLRELCRTPQGRAFFEAQLPESGIRTGEQHATSPAELSAAGGLFEASLAGVLERLAQTSEARSLLDDDALPPIGGVAAIEASLARASKGGVLDAPELMDVRRTCEALASAARHLHARREAAPRLAELASAIEPQAELEEEIDLCIDPTGEIRDSASRALADARREVARLASELQSRLARYLRDTDVTAHLSDQYFTVRNDRYVLPVKADSRGRIRGIVHDASRSGTTLFIEPEAVVDLNNRLRQAELTVSREVQRILRRLSGLVARASDALRADLLVLESIDVAFARGFLSHELDAVAPVVGEEGIFELPGLRHPLIPLAECVPNDVRIGATFRVLVISGPNAGGKTVAMKAVALAALMVRAGLHVACDAGARVDLVSDIIADIGDGQDIGASLSTFSAHMANLSRIVRAAGPHCLLALDEIGVGTDPAEGAALAQAILESLADSDARVITTTHYNLLKEMAAVDARFANASVEFEPDTLAPTYRLHIGAPGASSAATVAARMGMPESILRRAAGLLQREDRQLDRMLSELQASRASLEREKAQVARARAESEATRAQYTVKLERLQERRDTLFNDMRADLDRAFKQAHGEVAAVIKELQQGRSAQQAARARERLQDLETEARRVEDEVGVRREDERPAGYVPVAWDRIEPGDPVRVRGGREGILVSPPDRKGRVAVQLGSAKVVLPAEEVGQGGGSPDRNERAPRGGSRRGSGSTAAIAEDLGGGMLRCDLRGERVEPAIDRLAEDLDRAIAQARDGLVVIHGLGTGALKRAVREYLGASPYVRRIASGGDEGGGEGVTLVEL